jgi:hypothetical protein
MNYGRTLIDKAVEKCGSRYAVAKAAQIDEGDLSRVVNGKANFPRNWAYKLALLAEVDPAEAMGFVEQEWAEAKKKRQQLSSLAAAGVVATLLFSYVSGGKDPIATVASALAEFAMLHIVLSRLARLARRVFVTMTRSPDHRSPIAAAY